MKKGKQMKRLIAIILTIVLLLPISKVLATEDALRLSGGNNEADDNIRGYEMNSGFREISVVNKDQRVKDLEEGYKFTYVDTGSAATYYFLRPNTTNTDADRVLITWLEGYGASNTIKVYRFKDAPSTTPALTSLTTTACSWINLDAESTKTCYYDLTTVTALTTDITSPVSHLIAVGNMISLQDGLEWSQIAEDTTSLYFIDVGAVARNLNLITTSRPKP